MRFTTFDLRVFAMSSFFVTLSFFKLSPSYPCPLVIPYATVVGRYSGFNSNSGVDAVCAFHFLEYRAALLLSQSFPSENSALSIFFGFAF
jgi:hypothetical protein